MSTIQHSKIQPALVHSPDLVQKIYYQKEKSDDANYQIVFTDLKRYDFYTVVDVSTEKNLQR